MLLFLLEHALGPCYRLFFLHLQVVAVVDRLAKLGLVVMLVFLVDLYKELLNFSACVLVLLFVL